MWEEGVRVGWGLSARDRGGSGSRIAYIVDLYDWGGVAINLARITHKLIGVYLAKVLKRASCHISIDAAIFSLTQCFIFCDCDFRL